MRIPPVLLVHIQRAIDYPISLQEFNRVKKVFCFEINEVKYLLGSPKCNRELLRLSGDAHSFTQHT